MDGCPCPGRSRAPWCVSTGLLWILGLSGRIAARAPRAGAQAGRRQGAAASPPTVAARPPSELGDHLERPPERAALPPFASYYPEAEDPPRPPPGKTIETFGEAQLRAIHELYFSVGPGVTLEAFADRCRAHSAFAGRKRDFATKNLIELFRAEKAHFPWSWKTRALVASSHALVDRLLTRERGTTYGQIIDELRAEHGPAFVHGQSLRAAARELWAARPTDYPFAARLPRKADGSFQLEAMGSPTGIQYDTRGRLLVTPQLGARVRSFVDDPRFLYHFQLPDLVKLVASEIPGFGPNHVHRLARAGWAPTFEQARKVAMKRLCEQIHQLHHHEGLEHLNEVLDALASRFGYPRFSPDQISFFRKHYPELVPNFRQAKIEARLDAAELLLRELLAHPDEPVSSVGQRLGLSRQRTAMVLHALRRYRPEALPAKTWHPWTESDKHTLRTVVDACPIGTTHAQLLATLRAEQPELMLRHDLSLPISVSVAIRTQLGIPDWSEHQAQRFRDVLVQLAVRSPKGTSLSELTRALLERHPGVYNPSYVQELARRWKERPQDYPPIDRLLDEAGNFPWEYSKVAREEPLARRVGELIRANPGITLRACAKLVRADPEFGPSVPNFSALHVAGLRLAHPELVPYVDDLKSEGHRKWLADRRRAAKVLAEKAAVWANASPDREGLTVNALARAMGVSFGRMRLALERHPELFPWYTGTERGPGPDLYLATRVAHEMETARVGATLPELVDALTQDPAFREAYPGFTVNSFQSLRARYPDLLPDWSTRNQILRSKLLVDELLSAPAGASYKKVIERLRKKHPGVFGPGFDRPEYVLRHWQTNPDRFPFAAALLDRGAHRLVGRGKPSLVQRAEPNELLAARLARMGALPESLPLLEAIADKMPKSAFSEVEVVAVQHLLDSQVPTFDIYKKLGMAPSRTTVIGVPYSSSPIIGDVLADKGFDVRLPPLDMAAWFREVRQVMWEKVEAARESGRRILFIDDGGLAAQILGSDPELAEHAHLFTIVEQTRRGITVAEGVDLHSPLINVAQAPTKAVEGPMIGTSSEERLIRRLTGLGVDSVKGKKVGVLGHGVIGSAVAAMLKRLGAEVTVLDADEETQRLAGQRYAVASDRESFFRQQDIIIGSTGMNSIQKDDLPYLKDGVILGSTSSKLVEIDVEAIEDASRAEPGGSPRVEVLDADNFPPGVAYQLADGRRVKLLASGFPINFDRGPEDVPAEHIQLTRALMLIGALQAVGTKAAGFHALEAKRQLEALEVFEALGVAEDHEALLQAMGIARRKLETVVTARVRRR